MQIRNKAEFFKLWKEGVLGNRTNLWEDPYDAFASEAKEIGFREIGKTGGGHWEKVPKDEVFITARRWQKAGRIFLMDDGCPDWCRTIQGEICETYRGIQGFLDTVGQLPMRPAMAAGHMKHYNELDTRLLVRKHMDPSSQDDLWDLLEKYPDATIEFSCFGVNVGVFPRRNTIFWEVRNY